MYIALASLQDSSNNVLKPPTNWYPVRWAISRPDQWGEWSIQKLRSPVIEAAKETLDEM